MRLVRRDLELKRDFQPPHASNLTVICSTGRRAYPFRDWKVSSLFDAAVVPARLDDPVELGAVVRHETDSFDADVIDHPSLAALEETVVHRHLGAVLETVPATL